MTPVSIITSVLAATPPASAVPTATVGDPTMADIVLPTTILVLIGIAIPMGMLAINYLLNRATIGQRNTSPGKVEPYEGGLNVTLGGADERFSVKFYLIAMLFLAFDLEVAFLYPWAIQFHRGGWEMVWMLLPFLAMLEAGYLYLYRKGALDWDR